MRARFVGTFLVMFALAFPALAQDRRGGLDRILPQVSRTVPGTFNDAEGPFMTPDGRATYRIKWMTPDGRIIWLTVDANSGQVMAGAPPSGPPRNRFRDDDNSDRDHRSNGGDRGWPGGNWSGSDRDRGNDRSNWNHDDRGNGRGDWNRGGRGGDWDRDGRGGDWNRGGRGDWNQGGRGGDRGHDRGGRDRRHGG